MKSFRLAGTTAGDRMLWVLLGALVVLMDLVHRAHVLFAEALFFIHG
jgi:hypothetical protein